MGRAALVALLVWGIAVLAVTAGIAGETSLWFVVPLVGAAVPLVLLALQGRAPAGSGGDRAARGERELLDALGERGEITPAAAAMVTTLTVGEASALLEGLAREGHLEARASDGALVYALRDRDLRELQRVPETEAVPEPVEPSTHRSSPEPPTEPLTERELEVLGLLITGRTNAEIARDLFVAVGTVKAHVNNIYRKLGARNRAEAISRAQDLNLPRRP